MTTIKVNNWREIPKNFTGIAEYQNGTKEWFRDGKLHREGGPAVEYFDGSKYWYKEGKAHRIDGPAWEFANGNKAYHLENHPYYRINLKDFVVLDYYKGRFGIMWYKLLDKKQIFEYPDIPELITK